MPALPSILRRRKKLLAPFRSLHYHIWRATGLSGLSPIWPEIAALEKIVRNSAPDELSASPNGPRVLFITPRAWNTHVVSDALIAQALRQRGAGVRFFTCGGQLPACEISPHTVAPPMPCHICAPYVTEVLSALRLPCDQMHSFITRTEQTEIVRRIAELRPDDYETFEFGGLPLGQLVRPSVQWFLLSGNPVVDRETQDTYRRFLISGATMVRVMDRLLETVRPDILYLLNGIFSSERIAIEHARSRGIPFITHEGGFQPDTQVFSRDGFAPHHSLDDVWESYAGRSLTMNESELLDSFLMQREHGRIDVGRMYPTIESGTEEVIRRLGIDRRKQIATLFTNVDWDTACFAANAAFENMEDWLRHTIRHFAQRPDWQLIVRIHPAEVRLPFLEPRETAEALIRRHFDTLPENVRIVPPESDLSSYTLMDLSQLGLVYTSTTGMEMALRGKPVIVAGRSYYSGKGFVYEAGTQSEYDQLLDVPRLRQPPSPEMIHLARRYAFLFFFRHHIPFPLTTTRRGRIRFNFSELDALRPGREPYLDLVCEAILHGQPFLNTEVY